jgi:hypothetical protein
MNTNELQLKGILLSCAHVLTHSSFETRERLNELKRKQEADRRREEALNMREAELKRKEEELAQREAAANQLTGINI